MQVKKFEAATIQEALEMVKTQLGPDAIILSARDNKKSFGLIGQGSVEVTAAVSELQLRKKQIVESKLQTKDREKFKNITARAQKEIIEKSMARNQQRNEPQRRQAAPPVHREPTTQRYIDIDDALPQKNVRPSRTRPLSEMTAMSPNGGVYTRGTTQAARTPQSKGRRVEDLLSDMQKEVSFTETMSPASFNSGAPSESDVGFLRVRAAVQSAWDAVTGSEEARPSAFFKPNSTKSSPTLSKPLPLSHDMANLKAEIQELKQVIQNSFKAQNEKIISMHPGAQFSVPFELSFMFERLTLAGISEENSAQILLECQKAMDPQQIKKRALVDAWVARHFLDEIKTVGSESQQRVHLFVGPGGQGKTSSLVKMASHLVIQAQKKVAIVTTDTFKVGATDQLRIYSQILNVPFGVVRGASDWPVLFQHLKDYDYILVDFPGLALKTPEELDFLNHLLPRNVSCATHYVQSVMAKDADATLAATRYQSIGFNDVIFTYLDGAANHGLIYNFQKTFKVPLHSFGVGSLIPEDFEFATREKVLDLIFKISNLKNIERGI